jgi:hypothetical protein
MGILYAKSKNQDSQLFFYYLTLFQKYLFKIKSLANVSIENLNCLCCICSTSDPLQFGESIPLLKTALSNALRDYEMFTVDFVEPDIHLNNNIRAILPFISEEKIRFILSHESYICGANDSFDRINPNHDNYGRTQYKLDINVPTPNDISLDIRKSTITSLITENAKYTDLGRYTEIGHPHSQKITFYKPYNVESRVFEEAHRLFVNPYSNLVEATNLEPINPTTVGLNLNKLPVFEPKFKIR